MDEELLARVGRDVEELQSIFVIVRVLSISPRIQVFTLEPSTLRCVIIGFEML